MTQNASINNYSKNNEYLKSLTSQLTNLTTTKLKGTSRLIIWDRISTGEIIFEGKGLIYNNDLFTVAGRANQILQNLTHKNFGNISIDSKQAELENIKNKWLDYLSGKNVEETRPLEYKNSKFAEINSLNAVHAFIVSLQPNAKKDEITKNCLYKVYKLDKMPEDKTSSANFCNPDTYTYSYLSMLFGDEKLDVNKTADWWFKFWSENQHKLNWNSDKGIYQIKN